MDLRQPSQVAFERVLLYAVETLDNGYTVWSYWTTHIWHPKTNIFIALQPRPKMIKTEEYDNRRNHRHTHIGRGCID